MPVYQTLLSMWSRLKKNYKELMQVTNLHIQSCLEAWLNCENLLITVLQKETSFSLRTKQVLDECAKICLGTCHALKNGWENLENVALLCVGICEECAEVCERYHDPEFKTCASICRNCSSRIVRLAAA